MKVLINRFNNQFPQGNKLPSIYFFCRNSFLLKNYLRGSEKKIESTELTDFYYYYYHFK